MSSPNLHVRMFACSHVGCVHVRMSACSGLDERRQPLTPVDAAVLNGLLFGIDRHLQVSLAAKPWALNPRPGPVLVVSCVGAGAPAPRPNTIAHSGLGSPASLASEALFVSHWHVPVDPVEFGLG